MTANTPRSRKSKGAKFQNDIRDLLLEKFSQLEDDDIRTASSGVPGVDLLLSPAAQKLFPFACEAKRTEKLSVPQWWEQAKANSTERLKPLIITKQNRKEPLVILSLSDFLSLL